MDVQINVNEEIYYIIFRMCNIPTGITNLNNKIEK